MGDVSFGNIDFVNDASLFVADDPSLLRCVFLDVFSKDCGIPGLILSGKECDDSYFLINAGLSWFPFLFESTRKVNNCIAVDLFFGSTAADLLINSAIRGCTYDGIEYIPYLIMFESSDLSQ